ATAAEIKEEHGWRELQRDGAAQGRRRREPATPEMKREEEGREEQQEQVHLAVAQVVLERDEEREREGRQAHLEGHGEHRIASPTPPLPPERGAKQAATQQRTPRT